VLRAILIYLSKATWARRLVTGWRFARRSAARFIAGDTLDEALEKIQSLNEEGLFATLDHLGENVTNPEEALKAVEEYIEILDRMEKVGIKSNVSIKLTQLGLELDFDLCFDNMKRIVSRAAEYGIMIRMDIEDSPTVDRTILMFQKLREAGFTNVAMAFQSYLYRSEADLKVVLPQGAHIRLCKGAYKEPPEVAFPRKADVDANFDKLTALIIDSALADGAEPADPNGKIPPVTAIGTHDEKRIAYAQRYAEQVNFPQHALEFQMLLGIRTDIQRALVKMGYPVRIYVPFGTEWYPYFVRRLAERPANLWFFLSNFFRG
jgi:proline dehydrogenase